MKRIPVFHALMVILLTIALGACSQLDSGQEAAVLPDGTLLADTILDSEQAREALITELSKQLVERTTAASSPPLPLDYEQTYIELYQLAHPAIVNVQVITKPPTTLEEQTTPELPEFPTAPGFPGIPFPNIPDLQPMPARGQGSGFIYDELGHIITNNHVVDGADEISVVFADGKEMTATLVGADPDTDLAVIKVDDEFVGDGDLVPLSLGDSDTLQVGQYVAAIGNPFGLNGSMTTGIISGLGRVLPAGASQFTIPDIIQTDAAINPGNSGGPLLNLKGEVIGVNTAIASPNRAFAGVGYAVPVNIVRDVVPELIANGRVEHPWLGITGRTLDREAAEVMGLDSNQRGVLIAEVVVDGPAHESELHGSDTQASIDGQQISVGGDIIVSIDGEPVADFDDLLSYIVNETEVGQTVELGLIRDGEEILVDVTLAARPVSND